MALSPKRQAFSREYVKDFNGAQAAIRAGYSAKTARSIANKLLTIIDVREAIREKVEMTPDEVKSRLADIARGDMADLMEISTSGFTLELMIDDPNNLGEKIVNPKTKLIKKIKQKVTTYLAKSESDEDREVIETELELYSAHEALRDIGKIHSLFVDRSENLNLDLSTLTDEQLEMLRQGKDLADVLKHAST